MAHQIKPPSATALLNAAFDEVKHANTIDEALKILFEHSKEYPESMAAMWYRLNIGKTNQQHKLENKLPKVIKRRQREFDIRQARNAWKITSVERILQEIKKLEPTTKLTVQLGKEVLLEILAEMLADKAEKLKK